MEIPTNVIPVPMRINDLHRLIGQGLHISAKIAEAVHRGNQESAFIALCEIVPKIASSIFKSVSGWARIMNSNPNGRKERCIWKKI
jgi:hypothetical protein